MHSPVRPRVPIVTSIVAARGGVSAASALGWLREYGVYVALVILLITNAALNPSFLSTGNLLTQLVQVVPVLIVALGMALVIGTEGIDLSVGSVMAVAAALIPLYIGYGAAGAVAAAVIGGALIGLVNGSLVAVVGVQPIVATLALLVGGRGLAIVLAEGRLTQINNPTLLSLGSGSLAGIPYVVLVAAALCLLAGVLVSRTTYGRRLVAIGGNRRASELTGLPVRRVLLATYVLSGVFAATAGVVATSRLTASDPTSIGLLIELSAITAVVVGGTPLTGGQVRVVGTIAGALLLQLIQATLNQQDVPPSYSQMVQAAIILLAVYLQRGRGGVA